jgi:hypothetical protein
MSLIKELRWVTWLCEQKYWFAWKSGIMGWHIWQLDGLLNCRYVLRRSGHFSILGKQYRIRSKITKGVDHYLFLTGCFRISNNDLSKV